MLTTIMKQTFNTNRGVFSLDISHYEKMSQGLARGIVAQDEDISVLEKFINEDSVVADIGANIGTFSIPLSRKAKEVLAFEPVPENIKWLEENIRANDVKNITVFPIALGDKNAEVQMISHNEEEFGNFSMREGKGTQVKTLDSIGRHIDVLKIDVEGCEPAVLRGAQEIIHRDRPTILFEVSPSDLRMHNNTHPFITLARALRGYDIYLPIDNGLRLCRVPSVAFATFLEGPKAFVFGDRFLVLNFLASNGKPPIPVVPHPTSYLLGRFMRKILKKFLNSGTTK